MERVKCRRNFEELSNIKSIQLYNKLNNSIENLSNEIFYEIFDYLDGYIIYKAFSNLNYRFENLLINSLFLMKINLSSLTNFNSCYKHFLNSNKHRIISFNFFDESILDTFIQSCIISSSFIHLESIILQEISAFKLLVLLFYLKSLPRLFSLTITLDDFYDNLGDIYQMIFHLPYLKYLKLDVSGAEPLDIEIPITKDHLSSLEYLIIDHCCSLNQLIDIISYTPKISYLNCCNIIGLEDDIPLEILINTNNLIHLKMNINDIDFDEFEYFLLKLCSQLKYLSVAIEGLDKSYLDSDRWERLISKNMINLKEFYFSYAAFIYDSQSDLCCSSINRFNSSFWIERKWIFELSFKDIHLTFLIHPQQRLKYNFEEHIDTSMIPNSTLDYFPGASLYIDGCLGILDHPSSNLVSPILKSVEISRLTIKFTRVSVNMFIKLLNLLPNLIAIRLLELPSDKDIHKFNFINTDDTNQFFNNNKITKVTLKNPTEIQMCLVLDFFSRLQSLTLENIRNINLQSIIRCILTKFKTKNISHPMNIYIFGVDAENDAIQKLKQMIDSEDLLKDDYTIHRRLNRFNIQWK